MNLNYSADKLRKMMHHIDEAFWRLHGDGGTAEIQHLVDKLIADAAPFEDSDFPETPITVFLAAAYQMLEAELGRLEAGSELNRRDGS